MMMENNSKHQEGVGSYSVMEDLEVVPDTNRGVGIQQHEEVNANVNVMWPRWGDSTRLYDSHPAKTGSFHQVVQYDRNILRNILSRCTGVTWTGL